MDALTSFTIIKNLCNRIYIVHREMRLWLYVLRGFVSL